MLEWFLERKIAKMKGGWNWFSTVYNGGYRIGRAEPPGPATTMLKAHTGLRT
jgi:hypothetical protein